MTVNALFSQKKKKKMGRLANKKRLAALVRKGKK